MQLSFPTEVPRRAGLLVDQRDERLMFHVRAAIEQLGLDSPVYLGGVLMLVVEVLYSLLL